MRLYWELFIKHGFELENFRSKRAQHNTLHVYLFYFSKEKENTHQYDNTYIMRLRGKHVNELCFVLFYWEAIEREHRSLAVVCWRVLRIRFECKIVRCIAGVNIASMAQFYHLVWRAIRQSTVITCFLLMIFAIVSILFPSRVEQLIAYHKATKLTRNNRSISRRA